MRSSSPTRRLLATLGAAGLLAAVTVPAAALATDEGEGVEQTAVDTTWGTDLPDGAVDGGNATAGGTVAGEGDAQPGDGDTEAGDAEPGDGDTEAGVGDAQPGDGDTEAGDADGGGAGDPATDAGQACAPVVTHTSTGSSGATHAVAITSQSLAADQPGWEHVGWEAAEGTTLTEVVVIRADGVEHLTGDGLATGSASTVLELHFCGETSPRPTEQGGSGEEATGEEATEEETTTGNAGTKDAGTKPERSDAANDGPGTSATRGSGEGAATAPGDGDAPARNETITEATSTSESEATAPHGADAATAEGASEEDDGHVEVLGAQLTPDTDDADTGDDREAVTEIATASLADTGTSSAPFFAGGVAGLLLGVVALAGGRRVSSRGNR